MKPDLTSETASAHRRLSRRSLLPRVRRHAAAAALAVGVLLPAGLLRADTIIIKSGSGTLPVEGTIQGTEGDELVYSSQTSGNVTKKKIDSVWQIKAANEPKLTAAEQAFADGKWDEAVTNYQAALDSSQAEWVKTRAAQRLIEAAGRTKQFAPQVTAFVELAKRDPATARKHQPDLKGVKVEQINAAIDVVDRALKIAAKKESGDVLREYEANLYIAKGDAAGASRVMGVAPAAPGAGGTAGAGAAAPGAPSGMASNLILTRAKVALAAKNYQAVVTEITNNRTAFTDPAEQADALFYLAEAKYQLAHAAGDTPQALQDAAIAYMRLVAHFEGRPDPLGTNVPAALLAVGEIEETLKQPAEARQVYQQLANDARLKGTPVQQKAQERLNALKGKENG